MCTEEPLWHTQKWAQRTQKCDMCGNVTRKDHFVSLPTRVTQIDG